MQPTKSVECDGANGLRMFYSPSCAFVFATAILLAACFSSCARKESVKRKHLPPPVEADISGLPPGQHGGVFIQTSPGEPNTFNPLVSEDATSGSAIGLMLEGLTRYDPVREKVVPGLAKSWEIAPDMRTHTFRLREGVCWSDGHPLTADDVVFSFAAIYDQRFPNRGASDQTVDGHPHKIEKVDALTIRITAADTYAPFLQTIGWAPILPKHALQKNFDDGTLMKAWNIGEAIRNPDSIVASGPFLLHSFRPGERIVFKPNPHYWRADSAGKRLPYVDFVIMRFVKDFSASTVAFASGQCDAESITPDNVAWVKKSAALHDFTIHERGPSPNSSFIWFNQNPGKNKDGKPFVPAHKLKWFQNKKFRQAVSYGIDRRGIIDGVLFGRGTPLWGPETPANAKWFNPSIRQYNYSPKEAMKLLNEAGFKLDSNARLVDAENNPVSFALNTNQENPIRQNMATVFRENMKTLGIEVQLQFLDFGTFVSKIQDSFDYEAGLLGFTGGGDPAGGKAIYLSSGRLHQWNPCQPKPATEWEARIDALMNKQVKTLDENERKRLWGEVQEIMAEEQPFIYLITPNAYAGLKNKWKNIEVPRIGSIIWNLDEMFLAP